MLRLKHILFYLAGCLILFHDLTPHLHHEAIPKAVHESLHQEAQSLADKIALAFHNREVERSTPSAKVALKKTPVQEKILKKILFFLAILATLFVSQAEVFSVFVFISCLFVFFYFKPLRSPPSRLHRAFLNFA